VLDRGYANFRKSVKDEVRRIYLLETVWKLRTCSISQPPRAFGTGRKGTPLGV
jgi:hypothetical protein